MYLLTEPMTAAERAANKREREAWDALEKRIEKLEALAARALRAVDAGAGSRQWEKIDDARALLREALGT